MAQPEHEIAGDFKGVPRPSEVRERRVGDEDERETTPAPRDADVVYADFELPAGDRRPLAARVPVRTAARPPADLDVRLGFLLFHVDGLSPVADVQRVTGFDLADVIAAFVELSALGLVVLR